MAGRFHVCFYDSFDGWTDAILVTDDLKYAKTQALALQSRLGANNKKMGEHYGVIDMEKGVEVYCLKE